jgi:PAS domain S-box-containing protein
LDSISELVVLKVPNSKIIWGNRAFREIYGMSLEQLQEVVDSSFNEKSFTEQYIRDDFQVFTSGKPLLIPEEPVKLADGEIRILSTVKSPIFDQDGHVKMTVGISRDITDARRNESIVVAQREKLVVGSKMSALGEMSSGIAHKINNPLAVINAFAGQLVELLEAGGGDIKTHLEFAREIEKNSVRISKIINSLRSFSRNDVADPKVDSTLHSILEDTLELCRARFANHLTRLEILNFDNSADIHCHPAQISQVILNLLNNAHDAISHLPDRWIKVTYNKISQGHEISIEDSGLGIPQEIAEKIMNPFFTTKEVGKGTGLGLSISRGIVEAHGGELLLDDGSPHTRFLIRFPAA